MRNIVLKPEHLTMMMVANAGDFANSSPAAAGSTLIGIVRALYNYSHGIEPENAALDSAGEWVVDEILDAQEETDGDTEIQN